MPFNFSQQNRLPSLSLFPFFTHQFHSNSFFINILWYFLENTVNSKLFILIIFSFKPQIIKILRWLESGLEFSLLEEKKSIVVVIIETAGHIWIFFVVFLFLDIYIFLFLHSLPITYKKIKIHSFLASQSSFLFLFLFLFWVSSSLSSLPAAFFSSGLLFPSCCNNQCFTYFSNFQTQDIIISFLCILCTRSQILNNKS